MRQSEGACFVLPKKHTPVVFALNKIDEIVLSAEAQEKSRGELDNAAVEAAQMPGFMRKTVLRWAKMQTIALRL